MLRVNTYKPSCSLFLLGLWFFSFIFWSLFFCLEFSKNLSVVFTSFLELFFELFVVFFWSEFGTELLSFWLLIWNIISSPSPCVVAGFELFEFAEDVLSLKEMVDDNLVSFFSSDEYSDEIVLFVFKEFQLTNASEISGINYLSFHSPLHL